MANARFNESSDASSSVNVPTVSIKKNGPLPEEWTLPHEHSMEKREKYEVLLIFCSLVFNHELFSLREDNDLHVFLLQQGQCVQYLHNLPHLSTFFL